MYKITFTIEAAMDIQKEQLEVKKIELSDACYEALIEETEKKNKAGYTSAYNVFRGSDMDNFVANWALRKREQKKLQ